MGFKWTRGNRAKDKRGYAEYEPAEQAAATAPADVDQVIAELIVLADLATGPAVALQVRRVFSLIGIDEVAPETGTVFDADEHHVVATVEDADRAPGEIIEVVRPGWVREGTLLRPAEVSVAVEPGASMSS